MRSVVFIKGKKNKKQPNPHKKPTKLLVNSELPYWRITARLNKMKGKIHKPETS